MRYMTWYLILMSWVSIIKRLKLFSITVNGSVNGYKKIKVIKNFNIIAINIYYRKLLVL